MSTEVFPQGSVILSSHDRDFFVMEETLPQNSCFRYRASSFDIKESINLRLSM